MVREILSSIGAIVLIVILCIFVETGVVSVSDFSPAVVGALVAGIFGLLGWGLKLTPNNQ